MSLTFAKNAAITFATVAAVAFLLGKTEAGKKMVKAVFNPA
jgi:hypothetical protein